MVSAVRRAHALHVRGHGHKQKLSAAAIETQAMHSCLLHAMSSEVSANTPVTKSSVEERFITPWEQGSDQIDMELQAAFMDQKEDHCRGQPRD